MFRPKSQVSSPLIFIMSLVFLTFVLASISVADAVKSKEHFNKGVTLEKSGNLQGALKEYNSSITEDPNFVDAYINKGSVHFKLKEYNDALNAFKTASGKDSRNVSALKNLGLVQTVMKRYTDAIVSFNNAIAIKASTDLYEELAKVYYRQNNHKMVIETLEKSHQLGSGTYLTHYMVGKAYKSLKQNDQAISSLNKSISLKSNNYNALSTLGQIYLGQGDYRNAAANFQKAMQADPKKYRASYNYAIAVESADPENYSVNIQNWEKFIRIARNNPKAKNEVTQARDHVKELKEAQEKASMQ